MTPSAEQGRMAGDGSYERAVDVLEKAVAKHDSIAGDRFRAADGYVGSHGACSSARCPNAMGSPRTDNA